MMSLGPAIIAFARAPLPGRAKTRLLPALGAEGAAALYEAFLLDTLAMLATTPATTIVAAAEPEEVEPLRALTTKAGVTVQFAIQRGSDLGARLCHATAEAFAAGYGPVIVVGTDAPDLPRGLLLRALALAPNHDAVFGPCPDGGYYLVGLPRPASELFRGITWSSGQVLEETRARAQQLSLSMALLEPWPDVDTPEDLAALQTRLAQLARTGKIIPCPRTWAYLRAHEQEARA